MLISWLLIGNNQLTTQTHALWSGTRRKEQSLRLNKSVLILDWMHSMQGKRGGSNLQSQWFKKLKQKYHKSVPENENVAKPYLKKCKSWDVVDRCNALGTTHIRKKNRRKQTSVNRNVKNEEMDWKMVTSQIYGIPSELLS